MNKLASPFSGLMGGLSFQKRVWLFSLLILTTLLATTAYDAWQWRQQRLDDTKVRASSQAVAMDEFIKRTLQAVDLAMRGQAAAISRLGKRPEQVPEEVAGLLSSGMPDFTKFFALAVFDARGFGVAASEPGLKRDISYADRSYFRIHVDDPTHGLFVGEPLLGRSLGKRFFALSLRIVGPDGKFLGVIMGSVDLKFVADYFAANLSGEGSLNTLIHLPSKRVAARAPDFEKTFNQDMGKSTLFSEQLQRSPVGTYFASSVLDNTERIFAYRVIEGFPFLVVSAIDEEDFLKDLTKALPRIGLVLALLSVLMIGGSAYLVRSHKTLNEANELSRQMLDSSPMGIAVYDGRSGACQAVNPSFPAMLGATPEEALKQNFNTVKNWKTTGMLDTAMESMRRGVSLRKEVHMTTSFGREIWLEIIFCPFEHNGKKQLMLMLDDRTAARVAEKQLRLAQKVIDSSSEAIMITNTQQQIISVNAAFETITGFPSSEVLGQNPKMFGSGRHDAEFFCAMWQEINDTGRWEGEIWDRRRDGEIYPKWLHIDTLRDTETDELTHYVGVFIDITQRKAAEARIHELAHQDSLTGLANRYALHAFLDPALARAKRENGRLALMFIDLDHFKTINDSLGHHVGDLLLCEVAGRLRAAVREADFISRLGGDEFVVVFEQVRQPEDVAPMARKIIAALAEPFFIEDRELHSSPSIGVSLYPADGMEIETLMRNADTAMYHAKAAGRNNVQFFADHMNTLANSRLETENSLRLSLKRGEFELYYQPQLDLNSSRVVGLEALVRWHHPERGLVAPNDFIPIAEDSGLIVELGDWVLRDACRQGCEWLASGLEFGTISVNVSAHQFVSAGYVVRVEQILKETGIAPEYIELEITETAVMSVAEESIEILAQLKALGVSLVIDDFGTGYSSLSYLKRFPVDQLKIDRSFVMDIEVDQSDAAIASSIIAMAQALGISVIAEGVETTGQEKFLLDRGCRRAQGFLYSRPVPAKNIPALLV